MPQDVRKRDDKARTFAPTEPEIYQTIAEIAYLPKYGEESDRSKNLLKEYTDILEEKYISNPEKKFRKTNTKYFFDPEKKLEKLNLKYMDKIVKNCKKFYRYESEISNARIKYFDRIINENPEMPIRKISIITKLKELYAQRETYFRNTFNNNLEINKFIKIRAIDDEIRKLEDESRKQQGSSVFTYQNKFVKLTLLTQLLTKNNSKKLKDDINQILKELYNSKQITRQVYNTLNKAIRFKRTL